MLRVAIVSLALVVLGPIATRFGWFRFPLGLGVVALGSLSAAVIVVMAVVGALRSGGWTGSMAALLVSMAALVVPVSQLVTAGLPPAIHDISTDTADAPMFAALLPLRGEDASTPDYDGPDAAAAQQRAYPDIVPLTLTGAPSDVLTRAGRAARALGWSVVATDPSLGRLEATATTFWFRFTDDVVIRIRPEGGGSRLDIRSKSRVGRGDLGANARRIRAFVAEIQRGT
jgi:uncharacterized protein (DUF1499 family)